MGQLTFSYNRFADLFYYLLAHVRIDNAADVYDPEYTGRMAETLGTAPEIPDELAEYYRANFDRLAVISFFPLIVGSAEECRGALAYSGMVAEEDMKAFGLPVLEICDRAAERFYPWWEQSLKDTESWAGTVRGQFCALKDRFGSFFDRPDEELRVIFSFSLRRNGRAFGSPGVRTVYLTFPETEEELTGCFFQFLHECTHAVTDPLMNGEIRMADGSHDAAEYQVMCFDEYLVEALCPDLLEAYREWIGREDLELAHRGLGEAGDRRMKEIAGGYAK